MRRKEGIRMKVGGGEGRNDGENRSSKKEEGKRTGKEGRERNKVKEGN